MLPGADGLRDVRVVILNPGAETRRHEHTTEIFPGGREAFVAHAGTRIAITRSGSAAAGIELDRPLYSNEQIFTAYHDGTLLIADTFAAALEWLPPSGRHLDKDHLLDYLLFRTVPGTGTLIEGIRRIGQGESLEWRVGSGWTATVDRLPTPAPYDPADEAAIVAGIDAALTAALQRRSANAANLFSGGVDSTLLQSYLPDSPAVTAVVDSPEFEPERRYAERARRILGLRGEEIAYAEQDYRSRLEAAITALRLPPHHLQTVSIDAAYSSSHASYYTAQYADGIFGLGHAEHASRAWNLRAAAPLARTLTWLPPPLGRKARTLLETLHGLRAAATSTSSFAHRFAVYSDIPALDSIFGAAALQARLEHRLQYVLDRLPAAPAVHRPGLDANLELGHWIDVLCDDTVAIWGQLALRRGKRLVAPMTAPGVMLESLRIPARVRYVHRGVAKYWLKQLLALRVPAYPAHQQKYSSGLPFWRYYDSGPLRHALLDFERPSFLPGAAWNQLDRNPTWLTWSVLTYLIWSSSAFSCRSDGRMRVLDITGVTG